MTEIIEVIKLICDYLLNAWLKALHRDAMLWDDLS
jgi:hypothetical protein